MTNKKELALQNLLRNYHKVLVAFSGGIDSTLVLKEALNTLGKDHVVAVVANSELFSDEEYNKAVDLAGRLNANVMGITIDYLSNDHIAQNKPDTWYYSKKIFYQNMNRIAKDNGCDAVLDGMIMDDNNDFRPGLVARDEEGIVSPLQQANIYKKDVREIAKNLNLTNWNKVASCSISSRFPYYTKIDSQKIRQVMNSEKYLRDLGFPTVRVRFHNDVAVIEVPKDRMADLLSKNEDVQKALNSFGFRYVTLDLHGFESGRMNEALDKSVKENLVEK